jgi:protein-S-isoprenylcysteine O-methyltransferase Ste14
MPTDQIVLGLLLGLGLTLIIFAFTGPADEAPTEPEPAEPERGRLAGWRGRPEWSRQAVVVVVGAAVGAVVWVVFHLPVLTVATVVAVVAPRVVASHGDPASGQDPAVIAETASTVARWIETVRDHLLTAATLTEAMIEATADVHSRHRPAFARFAATLPGAGGYERAAEDLAAELDNALADKALVALWIGNRGGGDLQAALGLLAESAQAEADSARRIEAGLAGNRRLIKIVLILCVVILVLSLTAFRDNFDVYRTVPGQLLLSVGLGVIGVAWWSIWRLSKVTLPERVVVVRPQRSTSG